MARIDPIVAEMKREAATTRRVLERIPTDKLSWKPHPKSKSIGDLGWHLATIPWRISTLVQQDDANAATLQMAGTPGSTAEMVAEFDRMIGEAEALLGKFDDASLDRRTTLRRGDVVIFSMPRIDILRGAVLNHSYHHRGQLTVYLRLLDVPVPSVYGPTADEA
jgi:uncharacterized damage-inducible protein DinB